MKYEDVIVKENNCFENSNVITYQKKKRKRISKTFILSMFCFATLASLQLINTKFTNDVMQTFNMISQVGKPTAELFDENSNVFFVSFFDSISLGSKLPSEVLMPVKYKDVKSNGSVVVITPANNIISSTYDGQVKKIAVEDEKKVVYVEHTGGLVTRYENVEYIGVVVGQIVKQGSTIGSMKNGEDLTLSFTIKNSAARFEINDEKIRFVI